MTIYLVLVTSVVLTALAQITLKAGMSAAAIQHALGEGSALELIVAVGRSPAITIGLALYGLSVVFWLLVLSRLEVSRAYPFVGLGVILIMGFGWLVLGETLSLPKIMRTLLVATGVYLVASA